MNRSARDRSHGERRRLALAPGLLGAITALVGILAIGGDLYSVVRFIIAVVALIAGWFAVQARQWWWLPLPVAIAGVWNPVFPLALDDVFWLFLHYIAAAGFIVIGLVIQVPEDTPTDRHGRL